MIVCYNCSRNSGKHMYHVLLNHNTAHVFSYDIERQTAIISVNSINGLICVSLQDCGFCDVTEFSMFQMDFRVRGFKK